MWYGIEADPVLSALYLALQHTTRAIAARAAIESAAAKAEVMAARFALAEAFHVLTKELKETK